MPAVVHQFGGTLPEFWLYTRDTDEYANGDNAATISEALFVGKGFVNLHLPEPYTVRLLGEFDSFNGILKLYQFDYTDPHGEDVLNALREISNHFDRYTHEWRECGAIMIKDHQKRYVMLRDWLAYEAAIIAADEFMLAGRS